ncbi:ER membrane protein complex subunit 3 [Dendroctonus ponderosae]|uniref:ER membrane protein complex subunit 3 n=1 Tax=Dendroctonus ponderosae TaxID=77166 RepID=J3JYU3_DENPD
MSADLIVDTQIRVWVFLPIVVITFLVGIIRHYVSILLSSQKKVETQQFQDSQLILRSRLLRENAKYIPKAAFLSRRQVFNREEDGYLTQQRPAVTSSMMTDPSMMTDMVKGNLTNVLPMIVVGGWINWMFSGFITTKVPFPLTLRFKSMLQRGIELNHLDASWVSSASWYFLNVFGLRSIYALVLGENNAADQSRQMQDQMSGAAMAMPPDPKVAFKAEWEALEIVDHQWALADIESKLIGEEKVKTE